MKTWHLVFLIQSKTWNSGTLVLDYFLAGEPNFGSNFELEKQPEEDRSEPGSAVPLA